MVLCVCVVMCMCVCVCVCVSVKPEPPQGVTLRMSGAIPEAPLPFDPNTGSLDEKIAFPLDRLSPSTLETTLGQMAPAKSGRIHECHLIQVAL